MLFRSARARRRGAEALIGRIVETPRNAPCRDLYRRHHFVEVDAGAYRLALTGGEASAGPAWPEWIAPIEDAMPIVMAVNS